MTFVNPNIPALKFGREMEINAVNEFQKCMQLVIRILKSKNVVCLPEKSFIGCGPGRIVFCCCGKSCLEIKCPYSINYTSPTDPKVTLSYLLKGEDDKLAVNGNHQYYTQMQMAVTSTNICHFVFNLKFLEDIVPKFEKFYEEYLKYHWSLK